MFRALGVLRVVVLLNAIALNLYRVDNFDHPIGGVISVLVMVGWTAFVTWAYADPDRRRPWLLVADLAVAVGLVLVSPFIKGEGFSATIPGFWIMCALIAWAIQYHWQGGLFAGACLAAADLSVRSELTQANYGNVFLLLIGGVVIGFMCESLQLMALERDAAQRAVVATAERARLARVVHDGVLQVLALVQRRGSELGGEAAELGRMAGEQESALRALIRQQDSLGQPMSDDPSSDEPVDLVARLTALESPASVSVAAPAGQVLVPQSVAAELVAVVAACLSNVARHVGATAPAWVLLEAWPDRIELSVRDDGPGIPDGRLQAATAEGRLGVSESIEGRIADLGGTTTLTTGSFGTEWEFVVPRSSEPA